MTTTKENLCNAALELFIKKGYDNVSLREIASAAGTTIGNLTHHFPQKDLLLAALQEQVQSQFPINSIFSQNPEELLNQLINSFFSAQKNELENPYYYENICEFYKDSIRVRENITSFRKKLFSNYYIIFVTLRDLGIMKSDYTSEAYLNLTYLCVFMTSFWTSNAAPYHDEDLPTLTITTSLRHLVTPYIVESYLPLFNRIYNRYLQE